MAVYVVAVVRYTCNSVIVPRLFLNDFRFHMTDVFCISWGFHVFSKNEYSSTVLVKRLPSYGPKCFLILYR